MISRPYRRIATVLATAAGVTAIAVPAAVGLSNNPTFSQHIPVPVPSAALRVSVDDHGALREADPTPRRHSGLGDDHGRRTEPGDDRGHDHGDDHGRHSEPGDDRGHDHGDDNGDDNGHGGNGRH